MCNQNALPTAITGSERDRGMNAKIVDGQIILQREITATQIAQALHQAGGKLIEPTDEQRLIIESRHFGPSVIIAGAGSGKTETMSQRVLWLVANEVVAPQEILGLTFTRKAAGELSIRIRKRLRQLRKVGLLPPDPSTGLARDISVEVSTYHSYAGRTLVEHGIRMGIDADSEPLGEAAAWQLTSRIVNSFTDVDHEIVHKPDYIVEAVMTLSGELGEHAKTVSDIRNYLQENLARFEAVTNGSNEAIRDAVLTAKERLAILPMVEKVDQLRLESGQLTFNDQMSYAAKLVESVPEIGGIERSKYRVVLLDEYQDTSYSQVRFLSALFGGGHAVTAVGDPNQAIYGWRGASAETLGTFSQHFGGECREYDLLTTWRNEEKILEFANIVVGKIAELSLNQNSQQNSQKIAVKPLVARPGAGSGFLTCGLYSTVTEEAEAIADYFAAMWNHPERIARLEDDRSSFAVLVRVKAYIPLIESALRDRGIPTEVVGVGGLIHIPEIADIVALLRTISFPDSGTSLARLLVGPRLALGPKDLAALGSYSRTIAQSSHSRRSERLEEILENGAESPVEAEDFAIGSIIEAMEVIDAAPSQDFSPEGLRRLKEFAGDLTALRRELTGSITDVIIEAERFLKLDTEVLVRDGWKNGRRHLDKFLDEAAAFQRTGGTIANFLQWLETAEKREGGLKPATVTVNNRAAQILTVHAAKGAEWDVVAVPGLLKDVFPNQTRSSSWTKYPGALPISFRGDHLQFQDFEFPQGDDAIKASVVKKSLDTFNDHWKAKHYLEELRLGYVAFTRAKTHLFCTATWFREGKEAVDPSILFDLLHTYLEDSDPEAILSDIDKPEENPNIANPKSAIWPITSSRATLIQESALLVKKASPLDVESAIATETDPEKLSLLHDANSLVVELARRRSQEIIYLPDRLSVSSLINLKSNPDEMALNLRRPMPRHTDLFAKRGTEFHLWIERHFGSQTLFDEDLFDPMAKEDFTLKELQDKWLASSWGTRSPISVEEGFETVISGVVLRGRIDAVYRVGDQYEVVDWKTGRIKEGEDLNTASIQLAMYRLAYSKQHGIPIENIRAAFHYVADNQTIYRDNLSSEEEIEAIIGSIELI